MPETIRRGHIDKNGRVTRAHTVRTRASTVDLSATASRTSRLRDPNWSGLPPLVAETPPLTPDEIEEERIRDLNVQHVAEHRARLAQATTDVDRRRESEALGMAESRLATIEFGLVDTAARRAGIDIESWSSEQRRTLHNDVEAHRYGIVATTDRIRKIDRWGDEEKAAARAVLDERRLARIAAGKVARG